MAWVLLGIVLIGLVGILLTIKRSPTNSVVTSKQRFRNAADMQAQFKEAYMWACDTFGVYDNAYDHPVMKGERLSSLGVEYYTYYYASSYHGLHYPRIPRTVNKVEDYENNKQCYAFVVEFLDIVANLQNNPAVYDIDLFEKYHIDVRKLLTKQFEVDTLVLHSLEETN